MTTNLFSKATNPKQYDLEAVYWEEIGDANSPTRQFFREYLFSDENRFQNKDVLDVGSGTGWFLDAMLQQGAKSVVGIEPSDHNVLLARRNYPKVETILSSLEDFKSEKLFDAIVSVMVMVHIPNINEAMKKMSALLKLSGKLYIVVPPYEYTRTPRFDYEIEVEYLNENEYVASIKRPHGTLVDIVRKTSVYQEAAHRVGLQLKEEIGLIPTKDLLEKEPKYKEFSKTAIADLLIFEKTIK